MVILIDIHHMDIGNKEVKQLIFLGAISRNLIYFY